MALEFFIYIKEQLTDSQIKYGKEINIAVLKKNKVFYCSSKTSVFILPLD